jgi:putative glutamine amidotransferase
MKKVIGITSGAFVKSFSDICDIVGTAPILLNKKELVKQVDVIIFTGGADINPEIYGQRNSASYINKFSIARDVLEIELLNTAINLGKKILGVCRGHQLINAALGGTLVQEIGTIQNHGLNHNLINVKGIPGKFFESVNSMHHQGVLSPGKTLEVTSSYGGVVESTENSNIVTVQWHPEVMNTQNSLEFFRYILKDWS